MGKTVTIMQDIDIDLDDFLCQCDLEDLLDAIDFDDIEEYYWEHRDDNSTNGYQVKKERILDLLFEYLPYNVSPTAEDVKKAFGELVDLVF